MLKKIGFIFNVFIKVIKPYKIGKKFYGRQIRSVPVGGKLVLERLELSNTKSNLREKDTSTSLYPIHNKTKNRGRPRKYTDQELLKYLVDLAAVLGHTPSKNEIIDDRRYKINLFYTRFGTIRNAQKMAGLLPNEPYNSKVNVRRQSKYVTKEQCIEDIKRIQALIGSMPKRSDLENLGQYPLRAYYNRLGRIKQLHELPEFKSVQLYI